MLKKHFSDYLTENNREGSGKASSYIRAIDLLEETVSVSPQLTMPRLTAISSAWMTTTE